MGIYKTNYKSKTLGFELPTAYAVIVRIERSETSGTATFNVHTTRHNALTLVPLERKLVQFKTVKGENPYKAAYREATEDKIETHEEPIIVDEEYDDVQTVEEVDKATGETVTKTITTKKTRQVEKGTQTVETRKPAPFSGWLDDESEVEVL